MTTTPHEFEPARLVVQGGIDDRAFPAAVVSVGSAAGPVWEASFGRLTYDADAPATTTDTIFDLASLTKVIATASIAMRLFEREALLLDARASDILPEWRRDDKATVTIRQLLDHSSGLPAHHRIWTEASGREAYRRSIAALPLERAPGMSSVYSDPGFITLGFVLEEIGGSTLDAQFSKVYSPSTAALQFLPPPEWRERIAPTEFDPWRGRLIRGEVHDENAAALGGVAAHAGLFGTAAAVGGFARLVLQTFQRGTSLARPETMRVFATKTGVPGSSRALAWDTALPTSSSGARMSPGAIGHTGFAGTSLWIDPDRDLYAVLLTNRVHPTRANEKLLPLRARFHDALPG
jgi:CubicO group peptidase (beta-lactamase class C family)